LRTRYPDAITGRKTVYDGPAQAYLPAETSAAKGKPVQTARADEGQNNGFRSHQAGTPNGFSLR
jgi:hypothetical protein